MRRPRVFLDRDRIVHRHLNAWLLGAYFADIGGQRARTGAMDAYSRMANFCGEDLVPVWQRGAEKPPLQPAAAWGGTRDLPRWAGSEADTSLAGLFPVWLTRLADGDAPQLRDRLRGELRALTSECSAAVRAFDLDGASLSEPVETFRRAVREWRIRYRTARDAWRATDRLDAARAIRYQCTEFANELVIGFLAEHGFLPRFGFPINLLRLFVPAYATGRSEVIDDPSLKLERSGGLALADYAPGSHLIAAGRLLHSRGLRRTWHGGDEDKAFGFSGSFGVCREGHAWYSEAEVRPEACPTCDARGDGPIRQTLRPTLGFSTALRPPQRERLQTHRVPYPQRHVDFVDPPEQETQDALGVRGLTLGFSERGRVVTSQPGGLENGYAICAVCGFADIEGAAGNPAGSRENLSTGFRRHRPLRPRAGQTGRATEGCPGATSGTVLRNRVLVSREFTDLLVLTLPDRVAPIAARSLGVALQRTLVEHLEIDRREVSTASLSPAAGRSRIGLWDASAGGAGHVREALTLSDRWLSLTDAWLRGDPGHQASCRDACMRCLLDTDTQDEYALGQIDRVEAETLIRDLRAAASQS